MVVSWYGDRPRVVEWYQIVYGDDGNGIGGRRDDLVINGSCVIRIFWISMEFDRHKCIIRRTQ